MSNTSSLAAADSYFSGKAQKDNLMKPQTNPSSKQCYCVMVRPRKASTSAIGVNGIQVSVKVGRKTLQAAAQLQL